MSIGSPQNAQQGLLQASPPHVPTPARVRPASPLHSCIGPPSSLGGCGPINPQCPERSGPPAPRKGLPLLLQVRSPRTWLSTLYTVEASQMHPVTPPTLLSHLEKWGLSKAPGGAVRLCPSWVGLAGCAWEGRAPPACGYVAATAGSHPCSPTQTGPGINTSMCRPANLSRPQWVREGVEKPRPCSECGVWTF